MSRSYKKTPGFKDRGTFYKKYANRIARKPWNWDIPNGCAYKKLMDAYNICDWRILYFKEIEIEDFLKRWDEPLYFKYKYFMK